MYNRFVHRNGRVIHRKSRFIHNLETLTPIHHQPVNLQAEPNR
jgi:hypothetical protein